MNYSDTTKNTKYEHKTKIHRTDTYTKNTQIHTHRNTQHRHKHIHKINTQIHTLNLISLWGMEIF